MIPTIIKYSHDRLHHSELKGFRSGGRTGGGEWKSQKQQRYDVLENQNYDTVSRYSIWRNKRKARDGKKYVFTNRFDSRQYKTPQSLIWKREFGDSDYDLSQFNQFRPTSLVTTTNKNNKSKAMATKQSRPLTFGSGPRPLKSVQEKAGMTSKRSKSSMNSQDHHTTAQTAAVSMNKKLADTLPSKGKAKGVAPSNGLDSRQVIPTSVITNQRRFSMANDTESRVIHKTVYTTGFNPSKAIRDAARENGTGYTGLFDSKMQVREVSERNALTQGAGFNSKHLHVPPARAQLPRQSIEELLAQGYSTPDSNTTTGTVSQNRQTVLASVIRLKRQFMIHNTSAFFPMHFKIVIARFKGLVSQVTVQNFQSPFFLGALSAAELAVMDAEIADVTPPLPTAITQPPGKVPWIYQHTGIENTLGQVTPFGQNQYVNADFSLKGRGIWESTTFKENYEQIESFEKTIPPGDFWNFSHVHNCGGGIDIAQFADDNTVHRSTLQDPYHSCIWFETKGTLCEGILNNTGGRDNYLGTSPTYYTYEFKSSAYFAKEVNQGSLSTPSGQLSATRVHRREFLSDPIRTGNLISNSRREVFVPNSLISDDPVGLPIGSMFIPVISSAARQNLNTQGGSGLG